MVRDVGLTHNQLDGYLGREVETAKTLKTRKDELIHNIKTYDYRRFALDRLPILRLLYNYKVKEYLLRDTLAGISVGMAMIPQAMGYATVLQVPIVYGLYSIVFSSLVYSVFTTSIHSSCTIAISAVIFMRDSLQALGLDHIDEGNSTALEDDQLSPLMSRRLNALYAITFIGGIFILVATLLRLHVFINFSSEAHMSAIFASVTVNVLVHQIPPLLGIHPPSQSGFFQIPKFLVDVARRLPDANLATVVVSLVSLAVLFFVKEFVNVRWEKKLPAPVPIDIIVLVIGTILSAAFQWEEKYAMEVTGTIPSGVPAPTFPLASDWTDYIVQGLIFGFLSYLATPVMFRHFAARHNYTIKHNQEFMALGSSFILGSFMSNIGLGLSASRIFLMESCGGRTQVSYIFAALASLTAILCAAQYGYALPKCVFAAILVVTFARASVNFKRLRKYWRQDKMYLLIWTVTFTVAMLRTVSDGIVYGFVFSILVSAMKTMYPKLQNTNSMFFRNQLYYVNANKYKMSRSLPDIRVITLSGPVYFVNAEIVKEKILSMLKESVSAPEDLYTVTCPHTERNEDSIPTNRSTDKLVKTVGDNVKDDNSKELNTTLGVPLLRSVVLDMCAVPYVDISALRHLVDLKHKIRAQYGANLCLARCGESVRRYLETATGVLDKLEGRVYASIQDAITFSELRRGSVTVGEPQQSDAEDLDFVTVL